MSTKLYVGNLAFQTTSQELRELFAQADTAKSASVVEDRITGRSRGFAFVEMSSEEEAPARSRSYRYRRRQQHASGGALLVGNISEVKGATLIEDKDVDQRTRPFFTEIKHSRKRARKLQTEINRLKKKSQAIIDKLP